MTRTTAALPLLLLAAACSSNSTTPATPDSGSDPDAGSEAGPSGGCTSAKEQGLRPVAKVSTGEVKVLSEANGIKTIFVDGSAGGVQAAPTNPRVYVALASASRVEVSDIDASSSSDWDLAIERPVLFTNGGDGGPGQGGAVLVNKSFDSVTAADGDGTTFAPESFFDADCKMKVDQTGAVKTSFDGWYDYEMATAHLTPKKVTFLVKGGKGGLFKVEILTYYANPDGTEGQAGGRYTFRVGAL